MKYTVTYKCGHKGEAELYGRTPDREKKLRWMEEDVCPECALKEDMEWAASKGYPKLTGSEKQISWAESLRREQYETIQKYLAESEANLDKLTADQAEQYRKAVQPALDEYFRHEEATFYIDNRDNVKRAFGAVMHKHIQ